MRVLGKYDNVFQQCDKKAQIWQHNIERFKSLQGVVSWFGSCCNAIQKHSKSPFPSKRYTELISSYSKPSCNTVICIIYSANGL